MEVEVEAEEEGVKSFNLEYVTLLESRINEIVPRNATARSLALVLTDIWMAAIKNNTARLYLTQTPPISDRIISLLSLKQFSGAALRKTSGEWVLNMKRSFVMAFAALTTTNRAFTAALLARHPEFPAMVYGALDECGRRDSLVATWGAGLVANMFYFNDALEPRPAVVALKGLLCESTTLDLHSMYAAAVALKTVGSTAKGLAAVTAEGALTVLEGVRAMYPCGDPAANDDGEEEEKEKDDICIALEYLHRLNPVKFDGYLVEGGLTVCRECMEGMHLKAQCKLFFDKYDCECPSHKSI